MTGPASSGKTDDLLLLFLKSKDRAEEQRLLDQILTEHARPLLTRIIQGKLRLSSGMTDYHRVLQDSEDIVSDVILGLVQHLVEIKTESPNELRLDFDNYVAVAAHNAFYSYLRRQYPERWKLKDKLRYVLKCQKGFSLWETEGKWLCGFAAWRQHRIPPCRPGQVNELRNNLQTLDRAGVESGGSPRNLPKLVSAIFEMAGAPVRFSDLVSIVADVSLISAGRAPTDDTRSRPNSRRELPDPRPSPASRLEQRRYLEILWTEIVELPLAQRRALLFNLRDSTGRDMTALFSHSHVASIRQMAAALEMTVEELIEISSELPMEDTLIAARLGLTRQQVINLRNSARRRLARRMKRVEGTP